MIWLLALVVSLGTLSPLFTDAIGLPRSAFWAAGSVGLVAAALFAPTVRRTALERASLLSMLLLVVVAALTLGKPRAILIPVIPFLPIVLLARCPLVVIRRITRWSSAALVVLLVAAWVGLLYYQLGGPPLLSFTQYDQRVSHWYLTTLSVTVDQGFMRASSLLDEPGALSLLVCIVACLRILLKLPASTTVWLMMLGTVTGSLAHLVAFLMIGLHVAKSSAWWRQVSGPRLIAALAIGTLALAASYQLLVAPRLTETESGRIEADTRTPLLLRSLLLAGQSSLTTGLDNGLCYFEPVSCVERYGVFIESPLGPFLALGLANSLPYYLFLVYLMLMAALQRRQWLVHLTVLALFLQRPYVMNLGYATLAALYVVTTWALFGIEWRRRRLRGAT